MAQVSSKNSMFLCADEKPQYVPRQDQKRVGRAIRWLGLLSVALVSVILLTQHEQELRASQMSAEQTQAQVVIYSKSLRD